MNREHRQHDDQDAEKAGPSEQPEPTCKGMADIPAVDDDEVK